MFHKLFILVSIALFTTNFALAGTNAGKQYNFNLKGTGNMYHNTVPDIDGDGIDDDAICFDTDLIDLNNNQIIGTGTDCLSNINEGENGGLVLVGTAFLHTPEGTIITRGTTTVQPVNHLTESAEGQTFTHITGAAGAGNAIIGGTGRFAYSTGTVRLSGMVSMENFGGEVNDPIAFDCLFVIKLD